MHPKVQKRKEAVEMSISERTRSSAGIKIAVIGALVLILLIPAGMIRSLIRERENTRQEAIREVSSKWGYAQTITGPVLTLPYTKTHRNQDGTTYKTTHHAYFLPDVLKAESVITPEIRYRGIYEVALYRSDIKLNGSFDLKTLEEYGIQESAILWDCVSLAVGISDLRGVRDSIELLWDDTPLTVEPGTDNCGVIERGISARPPLKAEASVHTFSVTMNLNGSETIKFVPVGKETTVQMVSTWDAPSFIGEFLPNEREVTAEGFTSMWKVQYLNREFPQHWKDGTVDFASSAFGVELLFPADGYQKTMRTAKYAVLFIGLAFLAFFLIEVLNGLSIHPVQYLLVGVALVVFYTLLLSISEHLGFGIAYAIASASLVVVVSGYSASILRSLRLGSLMALVTGILYGYMFVVLQLQDYALLFGSIGLFAVVALTMFMTRKVDWYALGNFGGPSPQKQPVPNANRTEGTMQRRTNMPPKDKRNPQ
jgi:inner membrane protein